MRERGLKLVGREVHGLPLWSLPMRERGMKYVELAHG